MSRYLDPKADICFKKIFVEWAYWDNVSREKTLLRANYRDGLKKGIEQGREEGKTLGLNEAKRQIVLAMLKQNEPLDKIMIFTGFSLDEIEKIRVGVKK